ncbi:hypothetical protein H8356DRAFT_1421400 [Neocallimastix lanati (nom. inval.)]|nr:hypothetical protein H8356DRAFT_1421400 [Neocallimastix sp. JGI-2020a]
MMMMTRMMMMKRNPSSRRGNRYYYDVSRAFRIGPYCTEVVMLCCVTTTSNYFTFLLMTFLERKDKIIPPIKKMEASERFKSNY